MLLVSSAAELAEAVRTRRKDLGLTQDELAMLAGVGRAAIIRLENNPTKVHLQTVFKVAFALQIRIMLELPAIRGGEEGDDAPNPPPPRKRSPRTGKG